MKRFIRIACVGLLITLCSMLLTSLAYAQGGLLEGMHNVSVPASSAITQSVDPRMAALAAKHGNGSTASHSIALYDSNSTLITSASILISGTSPNTLIETQIAGNTLAGCSVPGASFGNNYNVSLHLRASDTTNLNYEVRSVILDPNNPATPYNCVTNLSLSAPAESAQISFYGTGTVGWYRWTDYSSQSFYVSGYDPHSYRSGTLQPEFANPAAGYVPASQYKLDITIEPIPGTATVLSYSGEDVLVAMDALNSVCLFVAGSACYELDLDLSLPGALSFIVKHSGLMSEHYGVHYDFSRDFAW